MNTIGTNIKFYRENFKLSKKKLSKISGVSRSAITELEFDLNKTLKVNTLCKLAKAFNVTPNDLIPDEYYK